jgi:hypothetical protein
MGTKIKPVQPTVIRDKKIVKEVIAQIHKPISPALIKRNNEYVAILNKIVVK